MNPEIEKAAGGRPNQNSFAECRGDKQSLTRPAPRRNCQHCGILTHAATCQTCRSWIRIHHHHVAMREALREATR